MKRHISSGVTINSGRNFTGDRQPVSPMPIPLKVLVRSWCDLNGIYMADDGSYLVWQEESNNNQLIRLELSYFKSTKTGKEYVFAKNKRFNRRIDVTGLMAVEHEIQKLNFDEQIMRELGDNLKYLGHEDT